ncbi:MAG: hypothetical protein V9H69_02325 [Anaerolineae bacterium]
MSILVYIEQFEGKAAPVSWEVLGKARDLADQMGGKLAAVVIGNGVEGVAKDCRQLRRGRGASGGGRLPGRLPPGPLRGRGRGSGQGSQSQGAALPGHRARA